MGTTRPDLKESGATSSSTIAFKLPVSQMITVFFLDITCTCTYACVNII